MALEGLFAFRRASAQTAGSEDAHSEARWSERVVTTVAVSTAVLVVAFIAVLMGMVGP